jgi:hypothetical protein
MANNVHSHHHRRRRQQCHAENKLLFPLSYRNAIKRDFLVCKNLLTLLMVAVVG